MSMLYYRPSKCVAVDANMKSKLTEEEQAELVEIDADKWCSLIYKACNEKKQIVTGEDNLPTLQDREESDSDKARTNLSIAHNYLNRTDWINDKRAVMEDSEWAEKYADIIASRASARAKINEIEEAYPGLQAWLPVLEFV